MAPLHGIGVDYRVVPEPGSSSRLLLEALSRLGPASISGTRAELWLDRHDIAPNVILEDLSGELIVSDLGGAPEVMEAIRQKLDSLGLALEPLDP